MTSGRNIFRRPTPVAIFLAMAIGGLSACTTSQPSNSCAFVDIEHLARPFDIAGKTLICSPKRVSAAYREEYFPGYVWGDDRW